MIWLALFTLYCFACALWSLTERRERDEIEALKRDIRRRLDQIRKDTK